MKQGCECGPVFMFKTGRIPIHHNIGRGLRQDLAITMYDASKCLVSPTEHFIWLIEME